MKIHFSYATIFICFYVCLIKANNDETQKIENFQITTDYQNDHYNYAASYPYSSSFSTVQQNSGSNHEEDSQRHVPLNFNNNDAKIDKTEVPNNNDDQPTERPKHIIRYSDDQINLPNPYLINSNIPKDGKEVPCPLYYPCKTNFGIDDLIIPQKHKPEVESSISRESATNLNRQNKFPVNTVAGHSQENSNDQKFPVSNSVYTEFIPKQQDSQTKLDTSNDVFVVCYGLECSTQVRTPNNYESSQPKFDANQSNSDNTEKNFIKNLESQILKAIINDLQYLRDLQSRFSSSSNNNQKPLGQDNVLKPQFEQINSSYNMDTSTFNANSQIYI